MTAVVNKTVCILVVFSIFFAVIEGEFSFSKRCQKKNGKFPIPGSFCGSFYVCENWKVLGDEDCPTDMNFNPSKGTCDYKDLYPCLEEPVSKECPRSNGKFLKDGTDCETYFDCCNGEPTEKKCPESLLFDAKSEKCEYEELVDCDGSIKNKECLKPKGKFLKPGTKCKIYFECSKGKSKERECPKHHLFNVKSGKCDWKDKVTCEEKNKENCPKPTGLFLKSGTECKVYFDCNKGKAIEITCPKNKLFDSKAKKCIKKELVTCKDEKSSSESSSSESTESSEESTLGDKVTPPSISPDIIFDSTTDGVKSPSPITNSTTEEIESPEPTTDATNREVNYSTPHEITSDATSDIFDSTTLVSQTPEILSESRTESIVSTPQITVESTPQQITDESSTQEIIPSPKLTEPTSHPTLSELTSDLPTIHDLTTSSTREENLNTESTTESILEHITRETTVEGNFSSTHFITESPEDSTTEEISSSYQTEQPSSYGTSEPTSEDILTEFEQSSSSFKTTQTTNTDAITKITSEIVDISSDLTSEPISSLETKSEISLSSKSDAYQTTIDPVLVGFVCPEQTGYYPHPTNKHKFIGCVHGNAYIMDCPSNLIYNHEQKKCVYNS